jgi:hypothetical protein
VAPQPAPAPSAEAAAAENPALLALLTRVVTNQPDKNGNRALHRALIDDAEAPFVEALLANGGSAHAHADPNILPLHLAAMHSSCPAVVTMLVDAYPEGVSASCRMGEYGGDQGVIEFARKNNTPVVDEIVALLEHAVLARAVVAVAAQVTRTVWPPRLAQSPGRAASFSPQATICATGPPTPLPNPGGMHHRFDTYTTTPQQQQQQRRHSASLWGGGGGGGRTGGHLTRGRGAPRAGAS